MLQIAQQKELETADNAYKDCQEQLASALRHATPEKPLTRGQLRIIGNINERCDELLKEYFVRLRDYSLTMKPEAVM